MAPQASTAAGAASYRFIPIEATTSTSPSPSRRRRTVKTTAPPFEGIRSFSLYQNQPLAPPAPPAQSTAPAHSATPPPSVHYNPQSAHPYFFPPVLAHETSARFPTTNLLPAPQAPEPPSSAPHHAFSSSSDNANHPNAALPTDPYSTSSAPSFQGITTAAGVVAATTANTTVSPSSPADLATEPPKKTNSASRPLTHPNPLSLGLTRISPPPECHYPDASVAATVIHAWSTSRNYKLSRQKSDKNAAGEVYKQYYLCSRHGRPTNTHKVTPETRQRRQRKSERIGCPMGLVVRAVDAGNVSGDWTVRWQLEGKSEWHNHGPATEEEVKGEEERKERNERRKKAKGLGNGKRGRRLKDPSKPARKRDRRKKKKLGQGEGEVEVEEVPDGNGMATVVDGVDMMGGDIGVVGGGGIGSSSGAADEQQLQQEFSRTLHGHELVMNGHAQHQHQHQHQPQPPPHQHQQHHHHHQLHHHHHPPSRPIPPPTLWNLNTVNTDMIGVPPPPPPPPPATPAPTTTTTTNNNNPTTGDPLELNDGRRAGATPARLDEHQHQQPPSSSSSSSTTYSSHHNRGYMERGNDNDDDDVGGGGGGMVYPPLPLPPLPLPPSLSSSIGPPHPPGQGHGHSGHSGHGHSGHGQVGMTYR